MYSLPKLCTVRLSITVFRCKRIQLSRRLFERELSRSIRFCQYRQYSTACFYFFCHFLFPIYLIFCQSMLYCNCWAAQQIISDAALSLSFARGLFLCLLLFDIFSSLCKNGVKVPALDCADTF